jgi:hypothetical protein
MTNQTRALNWLVSLSASATQADWETLYAEELPRVYNFFRYRVGDAIGPEIFAAPVSGFSSLLVHAEIGPADPDPAGARLQDFDEAVSLLPPQLLSSSAHPSFPSKNW